MNNLIEMLYIHQYMLIVFQLFLYRNKNDNNDDNIVNKNNSYKNKADNNTKLLFTIL